MVIVFLLMLLMHGCWCLMLQGTSTSYAQYEKWNAGLNGSLEFEFKTEQGNGLLLYTDDGGTNDFFEIKLVESALRLRYNLGGGAQILTVGHDLGDGNWHKIIIKRNYENTTLNVDGITSTSISKGKEYEFGHYSKNSDVYIGGMPSWYNNKLTLLALPSVIFEPKFNGFIRNLVYGDNNNIISRRQKIKNSNTECGDFSCSEESENQHKVIRSIQKTVVANFTDACETYDPCQHDGICISTDNGPVCECRSSNYEGEYCEKDKVPSEASFRGTEYLKIDLRDGQSILSIEESVSLQFKTRQHNGLIFYSGGGGADYLSISIKDGGVAVGMTLANGRLDLHIKPSKIRFDDNQWHKIIVQRRVQEISTITRFCKLSAIVDGIYAEHAHTAGSFTRLESNQLLVGGGVESKSHQASRGITNFVGCLRKVLFKAEGEEIELIEAVKTSSRGASAWGRIDFHCREPKSDPVTFTTRESHLVLPPWKAAGSGSISFKLRTNEPDGLVMYSQSGAPARPDLFAFEILDGHLYLHMDLGSGHFKIRASKRRITNGTWHDIALRRVDRNGRVTVDGEATDFNTPGDSTQLDLDGLLYIGGVGVPFAPLTVPPVLWSGALRKGYVGCMRDLVINGQPVDIAGYAQQQDSSAIRPACHAHSSQCSSQPCMHGGVCIEGWNRFYCDCSATPFTGPICGKDASTLYLNGSQYMTALMPEDSKTQVEEISMRFKTSKPSGILLATSRENSFDRIQITLDQGTAKAKLHIGDQEKILYSSQGLNDDMWHILRFSRRATKIKLQIDDDPVLKAETQLESDAILEFRTLHVGGYQQTGDDLPNFVGHLQQVFFNGHPYLEIARSTGNYQSSHLGLSPIIRVTGKFAKRNHPVHRPVTFTSKHTFVGLPILKAYIETNLYFQFKTRETNGLIFFNAGREKDFIAVELVGGHIHYVFDLGDGPVRIKDSSKNRLNDGKWHAVSIGRPAPKRHTLSIDDHVTAVTSQGNNENLDLDGILYVGGVEKNQYAQLQQLSLLSRQGFEGCLASFEVSGESVDLMSDTVVTSSLVVSGCEISANIHSDKKCTHDICANYGTCVQQWSSYTCDCDMTSFSGPTCSDEAVAYEFGPGRGVIMYTFPNDKRTEMMKDIVAMGFITSNNDAVLLRVESATGNDYLEIEIVEGNVFAVYNTGSSDHPIGEVGVKVNDNQYHVIRFTRSGANATLQVDDYNLLANHPPGNQLKVFDGQSTVQVGGRWNQSKGRVERPFLGTISGLVLNGIRVLELAAAGSDKVFISIRGDVQLLPPGSLLERTAPLQRMQQTPASGLPGVMDDLIFSGAGSGCAGDDEDVECPPIYDLTSDDLITPVYVAPTKSPSFSKPINKKENIKDHPTCDDEEDCEEGSGDPGTTDNVIVTSTNKLNQVSSTTTQETPAHSTSTQVTSSSPILLSTEISTPLPHFNISTTDNESTHSSSTTSVSLRTISEITLTSTTSTSTSTTTTTTPKIPEVPEVPELPEIPVYNPENYPIPPNPGKTKETHKTSIHSDAAKNAALIIAIIAGALIAIVLIILLILKFKNRPDAHYKSDKTKSFCQNPSAALLGGNASGQQYNSPLKTSTCENKNNKKRELKDIKEWYV